jgi:hypothetical protein
VVEVSNLHRTEAFVFHRNARLTVRGRRLLVERVRSGRPVAHVAAEMGISRVTAHMWMRRWRAEGEPGLHDRSSRPRTTPHRTTPHRTARSVEARVCRLRQDRKLGPARIGPILGLPASTVHRVLVRHGLNRLSFLDRPTGQVIRRYERDRPGELVHGDVKKLGRIPDGGGHKVLGRQAGRATRNGMGFDYIHSAVDDRRPGCGRQAHPPTGRRPTARSNASTAPCSTNGPTYGPAPATPNAPTPWQTSCTPTSTTAATPHSAASHPSAV